MTVTALSESVRRGYDALIAAGHTPEAIREAVLADDLDMGRCDRCVIGKLYELRGLDIDDASDSFWDAVRAVGAPRGGYGPLPVAVADAFGVGSEVDYPLLAAEWRRLVTEMAEASS